MDGGAAMGMIHGECRRMHGNGLLRGQMTVEFVAMFPAAMVIALVAVNALLFFSDCAAFDRAFRSAVCTYAGSPAYEQSAAESCALVERALDQGFDAEHLDCEVSSEGVEGGLVTFRGVLRFAPTLFTAGALNGAFGVSFPPLEHTSSITVDMYKPGVIV